MRLGGEHRRMACAVGSQLVPRHNALQLHKEDKVGAGGAVFRSIPVQICLLMKFTSRVGGVQAGLWQKGRAEIH